MIYSNYCLQKCTISHLNRSGYFVGINQTSCILGQIINVTDVTHSTGVTQTTILRLYGELIQMQRFCHHSQKHNLASKLNLYFNKTTERLHVDATKMQKVLFSHFLPTMSKYHYYIVNWCQGVA